MPVEYELNTGLDEMVQSIANDPRFPEFSPLREHEVKLKSCLKMKLDQNDEPVPPVGEMAELKKQGQIHQLFLQAHYILVFDYFTWVNPSASDNLKRAIIHRALMRIKIKETTAGISFGTRRPDINEFQATVLRFGAWNNELAAFKAALLES